MAACARRPDLDGGRSRRRGGRPRRPPAALFLLALPGLSLGSPNHDELQARVRVQRAPQRYGLAALRPRASPAAEAAGGGAAEAAASPGGLDEGALRGGGEGGDGGGASAPPPPRLRRLFGIGPGAGEGSGEPAFAEEKEQEQSCERVAAERPWEPLRIAYEFLDDSASVPPAMRRHIEEEILSRAIQFWSSALRVRRATAPLKAEYEGERCRRYGYRLAGHEFASDSDFTCEAAEPPTCGPGGEKVPEKYLRKMRVCKMGCPTPLEALSHLAHFGSACDKCSDMPGGAGVEGADFMVFVTMKDDFCQGQVQAHATTCVKDQCDRPIFGNINFCPSKISLKASDTDRLVSTAIHELAHALAFSSQHFAFFRHPNGTPKVPREADDPSMPIKSIPWSCSSGSAFFPDARGDRRHWDLSRWDILDHFNERGFNQCPCPIGKESMGPGCIVSPDSELRMPSCVLRLTTPAVRSKAREFFGCPSLPGAELENQPTSSCSIIGSHWEQRTFMGEIMVSAEVEGTVFLSEVTLALFEDSGWYKPDYTMADRLVKGVHWGFGQGCAFALDRCVEDGKTSFPKFWCTKPGESTCSLDRTFEVECSIQGSEGSDDGGPPSKVPELLRYGPPGTAPLLGFVAEADYCPSFETKVSNHICTDPAASTFPVGNVNFQRELFGSKGRCLESTLHGDQKAEDGGVFHMGSELFQVMSPRCYEVHCLSEEKYEVWVSDTKGGKARLGECSEGGAVLEGQALGLGGGVACAAPAELCEVERPKHLGAQVSSDALGIAGKELLSSSIDNLSLGTVGEGAPGQPVGRVVGDTSSQAIFAASGASASWAVGVAASLLVLAGVLTAALSAASRRRSALSAGASSSGWLPLEPVRAAA